MTNATIVNCTFTKNSARFRGGAIHTGFNSHATIANCIAWGNTSNYWQISVTDSSTITVAHSCVQGGETGVGNIDADPLFRDAVNNDVRLLAASPCFDAGDNAAVPAGIPTDYAGQPRIMNGTVDMGAFEIVPGDFDYDGDADLADFSIFQGCFNGPNRPMAAGGCDDTDLDGDADVDLADFSTFQNCFNGPNRTAACG